MHFLTLPNHNPLTQTAASHSLPNIPPFYPNLITLASPSPSTVCCDYLPACWLCVQMAGRWNDYFVTVVKRGGESELQPGSQWYDNNNRKFIEHCRRFKVLYNFKENMQTADTHIQKKKWYINKQNIQKLINIFIQSMVKYTHMHDRMHMHMHLGFCAHAHTHTHTHRAKVGGREKNQWQTTTTSRPSPLMTTSN